MNKKQLKKIILQTGLILIALELIAMAIKLFFAPHKVAAGGATGVGVLFEALWGWPIALVVLVINIIMLILAWFLLDRQTTIKILFGSLMLPVCLAMTPEMMVVKDKLLSIIVASALYAAGIALLYRIEASSGGSTVPPLIFKKYFNWAPAVSLLVIDMLVCFGNVWVSGFETFVLATFSSVITLLVMNYIETGLNRKKMLYVMSGDKLEEIRVHLISEHDLGITIFATKGGFQRKDSETLMLIVDQQNYQHIVNVILQVDPNAFTIVGDIAQVNGGQI